MDARCRGHTSVTEVALDLGFHSVSAFSAAFKATHGPPLGAVRRRSPFG